MLPLAIRKARTPAWPITNSNLWGRGTSHEQN
jgi:hypothetical protein